jgi:predicted dehydrogenase
MIALCEAGDELARAKAGALYIPRAYGSVDALLADKDVEVVHNCTPNHVHFEISKKIMAAGKHVISEKPLAMNTKESKELVTLAARAGVVNAIDFNYRYYPLVQEARAMVESGRFGDLFHANGSYTQDWLYLATDWNWRLVPEFSGEHAPWPTSAPTGATAFSSSPASRSRGCARISPLFTGTA